MLAAEVYSKTNSNVSFNQISPRHIAARAMWLRLRAKTWLFNGAESLTGLWLKPNHFSQHRVSSSHFGASHRVIHFR